MDTVDLIKLTDRSKGRPWYISVRAIAAFTPGLAESEEYEGTSIYVTFSDIPIYVNETPEEVRRLLLLEP